MKAPDFELRDKLVYMDNAATTFIDEAVTLEMLPYLEERYGNPESVYDLGAEAHVAVEAARVQIANDLGCLPEEIYFTSMYSME